MKATGIVRRIDDLGRIVIPKEIRRTLRIKEGTPLEIFTTKDGEVIFKKYSAMENVNDMIQIFAEALNKATGVPAAVCDSDVIVAVSGASRREFESKSVSDEIIEIMHGRQNYIATAGKTKKVPLITSSDKAYCSVVYPIVSESDCVGAVILLNSENGQLPKNEDILLCATFAGVMGKQMEN